jgi:hypothetical protein
MELLSVQSEEELEQFLGKMFRSVGRGLKSAGKFIGKNVVPVLGPALRVLGGNLLRLIGRHMRGRHIGWRGRRTVAGGHLEATRVVGHWPRRAAAATLCP